MCKHFTNKETSEIQNLKAKRNFSKAVELEKHEGILSQIEKLKIRNSVKFVEFQAREILSQCHKKIFQPKYEFSLVQNNLKCKKKNDRVKSCKILTDKKQFFEKKLQKNSINSFKSNGVKTKKTFEYNFTNIKKNKVRKLRKTKSVPTKTKILHRDKILPIKKLQISKKSVISLKNSCKKQTNFIPIDRILNFENKNDKFEKNLKNLKSEKKENYVVPKNTNSKFKPNPISLRNENVNVR